jgi:hypothetical protein
MDHTTFEPKEIKTIRSPEAPTNFYKDLPTMENEIRFEPTLYIFLGTMPAQIGWRLRNLLRQAYGNIPVVRFLWVDSDTTVDQQAAPYFSTMERAELSGFNADDVISNLKMYPSIRNWWPRETRLKPGFIRRGANQIRLVGRLALFRMYNDRNYGPAFIDKLRHAIDQLQQIDNFDATEKMSKNGLRYIVERGSARVVIFYSTCGAQGSSTCFDVAYLCRALLANNNPTIISVALLPPVLDRAIKNETQIQREKIRANTYAWFKENEYLLGNPYWRLTYPEGAPVSVQAPPFDLNFLIDIGNQAGDRLGTEDDIFTMISQAVFLDTGSSIGGAMRGFNANVSTLLGEFQGRRRAYSSLAAASLIFPVRKISGYASARLGQLLISHGLLAESELKAVSETASALVGRLGLHDSQLLETLLAGRQVANMNAPAIRKADSVEAIRGLVTAQETRDVQERLSQANLITEGAQALLGEVQTALKAEVTQLIIANGIQFTQAVLITLVADLVNASLVDEETASLVGNKIRLFQVGVNESDLIQAQSELQSAKERLRALDGELLGMALRAFLKKSWQRDLDHTRTDCIHWEEEINQRSLQLSAQREAANLYDQVIDQIRCLFGVLSAIKQVALQANEILEQSAIDHLKPSGLDQGIYELALEVVDADFIQAYYHRRATNLEALPTYRAFGAAQGAISLDLLTGWSARELADRLLKYGQSVFEPALENLSMLEALHEYYGEQAPVIIEAQFDRLVRYCHPFWQYNANTGIQGLEGKSIIGVDDEHSELVPARYRSDIQFEIKSTGFKHRIDVARVLHGLPAFLLRGMSDYKAYYDLRRTGIDPLHVLPESAQIAEVIPEERQEARQVFAVACTLGYIIQIGSWYYFDPSKDYSKHHIHPGRENRLGQGRENAEDEFAQRTDFVQFAETLVEAEIEQVGNRETILLLGRQIDEHKQILSGMAPENELRRQFEKEMRALLEKQRQLGYLGQQAPLAA